MSHPRPTFEGVIGATLSGPRLRAGGRFVGGENPPCPNPAHREASVLAIGTRTRADGTVVHLFADMKGFRPFVTGLGHYGAINI